MEEYMRPLTPYKYPNLSNDDLDYTAGLIDTDGTIGGQHKNTCISLTVSVTQAKHGYKCIEWLYNTYGGAIDQHKQETEQTQASFMWRLTGSDCVISFINMVRDRLTVKKREALAILDFPLGNIKNVPVMAKHVASKEEKQFTNCKEAAVYFNVKNLIVPSTGQLIVNDEWMLTKVFDENTIANMIAKRKFVLDELKRFHHMAHDDIPESYTPSKAYIAGVVDGDGCLDTHGKSSQHHNVTQKSVPLLKMLQKYYNGGSIEKKDSKYQWTIYSCDNAEQLIKDIAPYIKGKKSQVDMILNMKAGDAWNVHAKLRDLKGRINRPTPKIDKINNEEIQFKLPPKELPRGIHLQNDKYQVWLRVNKRQYGLGCYNTIEDAKTQYDKYKALAQKEKKTGEQIIDWDKQFRRENNLKTVVLPKPIEHNERNIYNTPSHTYQVKVNGKVVGSYDTLDEAKTSRDAVFARIEEEKAKEFEDSLKSTTKNIYKRTKKSGEVFDVKIGGNSFGAYTTLEEAMQKRNSILIDLQSKKERT